MCNKPFEMDATHIHAFTIASSSQSCYKNTLSFPFLSLLTTRQRVPSNGVGDGGEDPVEFSQGSFTISQLPGNSKNKCRDKMGTWWISTESQDPQREEA